MISGLWNGISGLNSHEKALSAESNNIANVNTIGHKADTISFQDLMYQAGVGKGAGVQTIEKDFTQGSMKITGNGLDVAINGKGFFMINDPVRNEQFYSRAGNFKMGVDGTLNTADNKQVLGLPSNISNVISSDGSTRFDNNYSKSLASQTISNNNFVQTINAKSTDYVASAKDGGTSGQGYKLAGSKVADIEALVADYKAKLSNYAGNSLDPSVASVSQESKMSFTGSIAELNETSDFIEVNIDGQSYRQYFDTDIQTTMNKFADKISQGKGLVATADATGVITLKGLVPGQSHKITGAAINDNAAAVTETVTAKVGSGVAMVESSRTALKTALEAADAKLLDLTNTISLTNEAALTVSPMQMKLDNMGVSSNGFGELTIEDGVIFSKEGDNKFAVGKLETVFFSDPLSLEPQGGNLYAETKLSGDPKFANPINTLEGGTLELSNSSLSEGLVDLMVYQRAFQANSQSVTTSDEFLKTAIELKK